MFPPADAAGNFTFNGVEPGVYTIYAEKLGYDSVAKKVPVAVGEVSTITITLKAVEIAPEGYITAQPFTGFIELGHAWTDYYAAWGAGTLCSKCQFYTSMTKAPKDIRFEASWVKPVPAPVISPEIYYYLRKLWANQTSMAQEDSAGGVVSGYWNDDSMPANLETGDNVTAIKNMKDATKLQIRIGGSFFGVAYQQRVDMWFSLAYSRDFPDPYSAFPPKG